MFSGPESKFNSTEDSLDDPGTRGPSPGVLSQTALEGGDPEGSGRKWKLLSVKFKAQARGHSSRQHGISVEIFISSATQVLLGTCYFS